MGTIAFRSEDISLPNGSKMALGIDGGHWVLIYQKEAGAHFCVYNFLQAEKKLLVDEKLGGEKELQEFKTLVNYFFENANINDLVTISPPKE
ncbi:hypothetical protein COT42_03375 [Candidatus Saganbacteria bacterium CG08_land_8_20_14_0_20_45_16]|uniref:Uncharacterized protein n=1 Tax=Candidatus Saganbacteria bacterium CG08_land_8_20_14_0_20_45_16 TaxID=2014293 RepID=A0A2H0XYY1_UNCSA|nr:MAG: hypothetical protein COT42_03375 [Candidatus Saganbacteria bacterium CG08_land_8_20_14_0_20_45_16]